MAMPRTTRPKIRKMMDLVRANSGPTLDTFLSLVNSENDGL